jgi:nucleoid-associated protein YgaU
MTLPTRRQGGAVAALVALTVFGAVVAWFGMVKPQGAGQSAEEATSASAAAPPGGGAMPAQVKAEQEASPAPQPPPQVAQGPAEPAPSPAGQARQAPEPSRIVPVADKAVVPSFDVVRIEPNGESVIAGRGAPGAAIELLRNGRSHARALADTSGLFAFVPPPLAPGSHEIGLTSIAPDGTRAQSRESVTVVISDDRVRKPLVTLTSPDRPTVVLSAPDSPEPKKPPPAEATAAAEAKGATAANAPAAPAKPAPPPGPAAPAPATRPNVKIVSVEAEEGGRLFVSGDAAAGATVRLYLNDSFIAPGGTGNDGKVSFAIGAGVRPGDYRVRLDDVDPVSGEVRSRAEVAFNVPAPLTLPLPPQAEAFSPDATLAGRPAAGPETPAPSGQAPLMATIPPGRIIPPAQQADSPAQPAPSAGQPGSAPAESAAGAAPGASGAARPIEPGTVIVPHVTTAIVSRGDNLWRISRRIYGEGTRYTVIYDANQGQIRNPDRIYPGQIFVLPSGPTPPGESPRAGP